SERIVAGWLTRSDNEAQPDAKTKYDAARAVATNRRPAAPALTRGKHRPRRRRHAGSRAPLLHAGWHFASPAAGLVPKRGKGLRRRMRACRHTFTMRLPRFSPASSPT